MERTYHVHLHTYMHSSTILGVYGQQMTRRKINTRNGEQFSSRKLKKCSGKWKKHQNTFNITEKIALSKRSPANRFFFLITDDQVLVIKTISEIFLKKLKFVVYVFDQIQ